MLKWLFDLASLIREPSRPLSVRATPETQLGIAWETRNSLISMCPAPSHPSATEAQIIDTTLAWVSGERSRIRLRTGMEWQDFQNKVGRQDAYLRLMMASGRLSMKSYTDLNRAMRHNQLGATRIGERIVFSR